MEVYERNGKNRINANLWSAFFDLAARLGENHSFLMPGRETRPLCAPLDLLADNMNMAKVDGGGLNVVSQSGAYGLTASPTAFLSHPAPAEVLV